MNHIKALAAAAACAVALGTSGNALAALDNPADTLAIDFRGQITAYDGPPQFADQESTVLGLEAFPGAGYAFSVIVVVENWGDIGSTLGVQEIDLTLPTIDVIANGPIGAIDNPDVPTFDPSFSWLFPKCSG